ncbi:MAG: phosphoribulokinase [Candidatus Dormiibacterota bacterium]
MADLSHPEHPVLVGVGGDSGSGKTTLTAAFYRLVERRWISSICLDDYHSLDRRERRLVGLTALNPRANNFGLMEEHVWALKRGETVIKPSYDHSDGTIKGPDPLTPRAIVIAQGLHPFLVPGIRHAFDLKVWLDPAPDLRRQWKVQRDIARRGYTEEQVLAEMQAREPDAAAHIAPQRQYADLVVHFYRGQPASEMSHLNVRITQRHTLPRLAFDQELHGSEWVKLELDVEDEDGQRSDLIEIDGRISSTEARLLEANVEDHMDGLHGPVHRVRPNMLGTYDAAMRERRHSDPLALTQLILAHRILSARKSILVRMTAPEHEELAGEHHHL